MFDKNMETEPIPERVLALCQLLAEGKKKKSDLRDIIEPDVVKGKDSYFKKVCDAAIALELVRSNDDTKELELIVLKDVICSIDAFRLYVIKNIDKLNRGQFYKTTYTYMVNSFELFGIDKDLQNVSKMIGILNEMNDTLGLTEKNIRAWRFWATFLGFGYLHDMFFMPNAAVYIECCIRNSSIKTGEKYTMSQFIGLLHPYIDICMKNSDEAERKMNFALSNAFRTLHDLGKLELIYVNDREDEWNLYEMNLHPITTFTDIIYKGE